MSILSSTTPVTLVANKALPNNPLITPMLNPDNTPKTDLLGNPLGSIRLQQQTRSVNGGSFLNERNRVAFIGASIEVLERLVNENKLVDGSQFPGKIMVTESLEAFWPKQSCKINPNTAEQIGVTVDSKFYPVYLRMTYVEDINAKDTYIRTAEDVNNWYSVRKTLASTSATPPVETAALPTAP